MDEEWKLNEDDVERQETSYSQHSPNMNVVPNTYLNQVIKFENMKKVGGTYESEKKKTTHALIFTSWMEKAWMKCRYLRPCTVTVKECVRIREFNSIYFQLCVSDHLSFYRY